MTHLAPTKFFKKAIICTALCLGLSGCAGTIIAGLTLGEILTAGSVGSAILTGKGLGEHAMDVVSGQDCRILEAFFREDRAVCEPKDSIATKGDFKGLASLLDEPDGKNIQVVDLPIGKDQFTAINPAAKAMSGRVLSSLTAKNIQIPSSGMSQDYADLVQFTKTAEKFDLKPMTINAVATSDLRKRLTASSLFSAK